MTNEAAEARREHKTGRKVAHETAQKRAQKTAEKTAQKTARKRAQKAAHETAGEPPRKAARKRPAPAKKAPDAAEAADAAKKSPASKSAAKKPAKKAPAPKTAAPKAARAKTAVKKAGAKKTAARKQAATAPAKDAAALPLPPTPEGSEDWTPAELQEVRAALVQQVAELRREYDEALADLEVLQRQAADGAGDDQADAGTKTFEREQEMSIAQNKLALLSQDERAIGRIDAGTYGRCTNCGRPIVKARLQAFPSATLCVSCKQREERR